MEKVTHKTHLKTLCLIILAFLMINLIGISLISAFEFDNIKDVKETKGTAGYFDIEIKNAFGLGKTLWTGTLEKNTEQCGLECSAEMEIILHEEGELISDVKFMVRTGSGWIEEEIKGYEFSIKNGKQTSHKEMQEVCEVIGDYGNGTDITSCSNQLIDVYEDDYDVYNIGDELPAGNYYANCYF